MQVGPEPLIGTKGHTFAGQQQETLKTQVGLEPGPEALGQPERALEGSLPWRPQAWGIFKE